MENLDDLRVSLQEGRLARGEFLRRALALGLSLPAAGALLASWGRGGAGIAQAAVAATPKRGGILKFARNFEPVTLGPFGAADNGTIWTIMMVYDQLVEYQPGNTTSMFMNLRVADIRACYEEWEAKGAEFVTPPIATGLRKFAATCETQTAISSRSASPVAC